MNNSLPVLSDSLSLLSFTKNNSDKTSVSKGQLIKVKIQYITLLVQRDETVSKGKNVSHCLCSKMGQLVKVRMYHSVGS